MNLEWFRNKSNQHLSIILAFILIAGTCFMLGKSYSETKATSDSPIVTEDATQSESISQIEEALSPTPVTETATSNTTTSSSAASSSSTKAAASFPVNINTASATELDAIPYIGEVKAKAIVDYRNAHGPFQSVQELVNVKGIGPATLNKIKDKITI